MSAARDELARQGVRIVEIEGMRYSAVYVREASVLLTVPEVDEDTLQRAMDAAGLMPSDGESDGFEDVLLSALGVTLVEVPGMTKDVFVRSQRVGLIRKGLSAAQRAKALERMFVFVCETEDEE